MLTLIILLSFLLASSADVHSLKYFYTGSSGIPGFPEFIGVGYVDRTDGLDGIEIMYYDSNLKKAIPKQDWRNLDPDYWRTETQVAVGYERAFKADIGIIKERFNQTGEWLHTVQKMYGCQWDDETQAIDGFEQFGYDGEDFMALDLRNMRWIAPTAQAQITTNRWNNDVGALAYRRKYFHNVCVEWLKKYVLYGDNALRRKDRPEVSVLQKGSEVACHATGFYPEAVMITWKRNGVEMDDDVDVGDTLPNHDGTFQKRAVLTVSPEEREKAQYSCEVLHKSGNQVVAFHEDETVTINTYVITAVFLSMMVVICCHC